MNNYEVEIVIPGREDFQQVRIKQEVRNVAQIEDLVYEVLSQVYAGLDKYYDENPKNNESNKSQKKSSSSDEFEFDYKTVTGKVIGAPTYRKTENSSVCNFKIDTGKGKMRVAIWEKQGAKAVYEMLEEGDEVTVKGTPKQNSYKGRKYWELTFAELISPKIDEDSLEDKDDIPF